jgi:YesN/AraC family two-component response regulator
VGNFDSASKIIKDLFNQNLDNKTISYRFARLFKMELFSTILKVMYEINSAYQVEFADKAQKIEELLKNDNTDETLNRLLEIVKEMCDYINDNKKSHNNNLCENILLEVEKKLFEPNLTSQDIANSFGVTGNYLLRFFKEQMGVGLFDYIHEKRMQKAKELLVETNMRINDVAEFVGYYNTNTFIRIFKKVEGVSPGQYRKNQETAFNFYVSELNKSVKTNPINIRN